ncbi:hypothetical protein D3C86_1235690 [compost metagenome]
MRLAPAEDEKIQRQHGEDEPDEGGPHPGLADANGGHLSIQGWSIPMWRRTVTRPSAGGAVT